MGNLRVTPIDSAKVQKSNQQQAKKVKEESVSFFDERWSGYQISRLTGDNAFTDWLQNKDKKCTDGKDDGKIGFWEGAKNFAKGLLGGIPKAVINHPVTTAAVVVGGAALIAATGGAAAPLLVAAGAAAGAVQVGAGAYKAATAKTDAEAKTAWEGIGTGTAVIGLSAAAVKTSNQAAAKGGVKSLQGLENESFTENVSAGVKAIPEAFTQSGKNIKGNYLTWKTGIIHANSNATRNGVEVGVQAGNKVQDAYKVDLNGTVEEVLAKNPGLEYDAAQGKYYVNTSWGERMYIQNENYMYVKYGESVDPKTGKVTIDHNAVEGKEFYDTYIDHTKFEATGTKRYINPENLKPGQHVETSKNAPARFKVVPEGTKYMSAEGEGTVQPKSVLRIDGQGRPYQSTVEFMLKKVQLNDAQIEQLAKVDPAMVAKYKPQWFAKNYPTQYLQMNNINIPEGMTAERAASVAERVISSGKTPKEFYENMQGPSGSGPASAEVAFNQSKADVAKIFNLESENVTAASKKPYAKPAMAQLKTEPKSDLCSSSDSGNEMFGKKYIELWYDEWDEIQHYRALGYIVNVKH